MDVTSYLLGKKSGGGTPNLEDLNVTPSTSEQSFNHEGKDGYDNVTVEAVTSSIDSNIQAENIKKDVEILGVTGTLEGGEDISEYFNTEVKSDTEAGSFMKAKLVKKIPTIIIGNNVTKLDYFLYDYKLNFLPKIICPVGQITSMRTCFGNTDLNDLTSFFEDVDTSKVTNFSSMSLPTSLYKIDTEIDSSSCVVIGNIAGYVTLSAFTTFGGFKDLGKAYKASKVAHNSDYKLNLSNCTGLTEQSLINVLNNLYDIASLGVQQQDCQLGATNLAKLTSPEGQQALADAQTKGWLVS